MFLRPPAVDHAKDGWLFPASAVMLEALLWGFPSVFGVFQDYYITHPPFAGSQSTAVIGTCAMATMYLGIACGVCVMCLAQGLGSFSTSAPQLITSRGIVYTVGGGFAWTLILQYMPEWFDKMLSLAYGIVLAGSALAGVVLPPLVQWLLYAYGYQTTLRVCAIFMFLLAVPMLRTAGIFRSRNVSQNFLIAQAGEFIEAQGYFIPFVYLPSHVRLLGANHFRRSLTVILLNGAACVACIVMGALMDRYHFSIGVHISSLGTIMSVFCFWVFSVLYGLLGCAWLCTRSGVVTEMQKQGRVKDPGLVFATLAAGQGTGSIASGPLSELLIRGRYGAADAFTSVTAFVGNCSVVARRASWI
ncbi:MFS general substrate transporter [Paraphaeosphaeria sporulosa]|uniref:MFS general substrate transporter n=1 Tax=Paraphaeosphaeria sporulosa TaxID=1460663 RepID=A0A177C3J0_9PLEO|nr:MFS general substrate transporter [Paraphaeosphaeria sporulosa]OAG01230.1 MFS general substrate transporter [Paraphaeosphaeria sporulosa]